MIDMKRPPQGPLHQYYDLVIRNYSSPDHESEIPLRFLQNQSTPIVPNAKSYEMSVVRFQMDSFLLPCLLFQPELGQSDPNLGSYTLTLEWDDGVGTLTSGLAENIVWIPQKQNAPVPTGPSLNPNGLADYSEYYFCTSYNYFCQLMNTAFTSAMAKLNTLTGGVVLATVEAPFITWSSDGNKATMYARESHFDSSSTGAHVNIYFNRSTFSLFNSFSYLKFGVANPNKKYYQLLMDRFQGEKVINLPNFGIDMLIWSEQELSTIDQWTPVGSIAFTSSTLPIQANQMSQPAIYENGVQRNLGNTYQNFANIITDISSDEAYRPSLLYNPTAEYRLITLHNDSPIYQFDIEVYWRDKLGVLRPMHLPPNASCSMKVMFRKLMTTEVPTA